jgi:formamidopyrimidine-DNA glycosylase
MPEGPEIMRMVRSLRPIIRNNILTKIRVINGRYKRHPGTLGRIKLPVKMLDIKCHGKLIWIEMASGPCIVLTMGMTGHLLAGSCSNIVFETNVGNFCFKDPRNFGTIRFMQPEAVAAIVARMGPSVYGLQSAMAKVVYNKAYDKYPDKLICQVVVDQRMLAGAGNYMRSEALYMANIDPFRKMRDITFAQFMRIIQCMQQIFKIALRGSYKMKIYRTKRDGVMWKEIDGRRVYYF